MKKIIFAVLAGAAVIATGCVSTVSDTKTLATTWSKDRGFEAFGWHFKRNDKWGLLDLDGRVVLDADFGHQAGELGGLVRVARVKHGAAEDGAERGEAAAQG